MRREIFKIVFMSIVTLIAIYYIYISTMKLKKCPFAIRKLDELFLFFVMGATTYLVNSEKLSYLKLCFWVILITIVVIIKIINFKNYYITIYNVKSLSNLTSILEDTLASRGIKYSVTHDSNSEISDYNIIISNYREVSDFKEVILNLKKKIAAINDDRVQPKLYSYIVKATLFTIASLSIIVL